VGADFPLHSLAAFDRIHLDAGQTRSVTIHVPIRALQYWSTTAGKWLTPSGPRDVLVGRSSRDLPLKTSITIQ
jgi:beta-glucosidase